MTSTIFDMPQPEYPYDFVILLGVLEHIRDLRAALSKLREQLADDGHVFVGVPDAAHLVTTRDAPFQEFSNEHINFFSPASLSNLMSANGFGKVSCEALQIEVATGVTVPAALGTFRKSGGPLPVTKEEETARGLTEYIREGKRLDAELKSKLDRAVARGRALLVWGVGTHTRRLLAARMLPLASVSAFVDSSPKFHCQDLNGIPIISLAELKHRSEPILISSYGFQEEISRQIREELGLSNEIITLYDKNEAGAY